VDNRIVMKWPQATAKRPHGMVVNESEKLNVLAAAKPEKIRNREREKTKRPTINTSAVC